MRRPDKQKNVLHDLFVILVSGKAHHVAGMIWLLAATLGLIPTFHYMFHLLWVWVRHDGSRQLRTWLAIVSLVSVTDYGGRDLRAAHRNDVRLF